jgi:hypothetical protein
VAESDDGYYVYGLIDPAVLRRTKGDLLSIFYVGKGRNDRLNDHEREELRDLRAETQRVIRGSKSERIREILGRGEKIRSVRLSSGYQSSDDAYRAESLTIAVLNALLDNAGMPQLTNSNRGNYAGFITVDEHMKFVTGTPLDVPVTGTERVLFVKGSTAELPAGGHRVLPDGLPEQFTPFRNRIKILGYGNPAGEFSRPGWDPHNPWDGDEARERARRYWRIGQDRVLGWLEAPSTAPCFLLLAIPDRREGTVIRYAWEIDVMGEWEYYLTDTGDFDSWGVPLGKRDHEHRLLGRSLRENRDGKIVQVLQNYAQGWRVIDV